MRTLCWANWIGMMAAAVASSQASDRNGTAEAHVTAVSGQVSRIRDTRPWALSDGENVPIQQAIRTGPDGYAHFEVAGGSSFDIYSNARIVFRQNAANTGDLLDVLAGRVRIHLQPSVSQQRVFTPVAIISTHQPATIALAVDEDEAVRIDVIEGEVRVQHKFLPRNDPVLVKAVDAILVQKDQSISHQVERGCLYRYTVKIWSAITFGHGGNHAEPIEGTKLLTQWRSARWGWDFGP